VKEASDGQEALDIWRAWQPHLIWMDLRMPVLDGSQATFQIKATEAGQQTKVIIVSASVLEEEKQAVFEAGCDDFLRKPFRHHEIFDLLHKHLGVRFVYAEEDVGTRGSEPASGMRSSMTASGARGSVPLQITEALAALPEDVAAEFRRAVETISLDDALNLIERIRLHNAPLAESLAELVHGYRFDRLQELFEKT
jgi:CheY-like chemotaxis protein